MASIGHYFRAAFNARPMGMPVPPNWIGLAAFGLLGLLNPGFWLIGAGAELAYLLACVTSKRFRRVVDGRAAAVSWEASRSKLKQAMALLGPEETERFLALEERCRLALGEQTTAGEAWRAVQAESLAKLRWAYLQLLAMHRAVVRVLQNDGAGVSDPRSVSHKIAELDSRLRDDGLGADLRKSLQSQRDVLAARSGVQREAIERLEQIEAELGRIEAHVELLREQSLLAADPDAASARIDTVASSLEGTNRWIKEHQAMYDGVEAVLDEAPALERQ